MILKIKHYVIFITIGSLISCQTGPKKVSEVHAKQLSLNDSIAQIDSIDSYITPFRNRIDQVLDSPLAYASHNITKTKGALNTNAGNLLADIVFEQTKPIFKSRTGNDLDFVLLNYGGIRAVISKGTVTARTAYEVMPFENSITTVAMNGRAIRELVNYLVKSSVPHPISGIQIVVDKNKNLQAVTIQGKPFDEERIYYVATSNYLVSGGDNMVFFEKATSITEIDYIIRNAIIDYFKKVDTIAPVIDDRFIQKK